jgi:hypothetical protein
MPSLFLVCLVLLPPTLPLFSLFGLPTPIFFHQSLKCPSAPIGYYIPSSQIAQF